jgi:hypothetical protein
VFPAVVDANALRDDVLRMAAGRGRTLMMNAADTILDEVDEHQVVNAREVARQQFESLLPFQPAWTEVAAFTDPYRRRFQVGAPALHSVRPARAT